MDKEEIIRRLKKISGHAVHAVGEPPFIMSLDDGIALDEAVRLLKEQKAEAKWIYGEDKTGVDGWHCSECNFFEPWFYEFTEDIDFVTEEDLNKVEEPIVDPEMIKNITKDDMTEDMVFSSNSNIVE